MIEILLNTPLAADMIRKGEVHKLKELMKKSGEQGMITFDQALFDLYQEGEISFEDALRLGRLGQRGPAHDQAAIRRAGRVPRAWRGEVDKISLVDPNEP